MLSRSSRHTHGIAALAAVLLLLTGAAHARQEETARSPEAARKEYFDLDIPLLDGGTLQAEDLRGKILVVDIWGTWCGPCRHSVPKLVEIAARYGPRGVEVIGISAEVASSEEAAIRRVKRHAAELGINYVLGILDEDIYRRIRFLMRFEGDSFAVPSTFVVDRDGAVIARYPGYFFGQEKEIEKLLDERLGIRAAESGSP